MGGHQNPIPQKLARWHNGRMTTGPGASREDLMFEAAYLYYMEGLTQQAIGAKLGYTRWTIGRLIDEARETGLVSITINHPRAQTHHIEQKIAHALGVQVVVVPGNNTDGIAAAARAAAKYLVGLSPVRTLGVSWGRTMTALASALSDGWANGVVVYQANGGPTHRGDNEVSTSVSAIAHKGRGTAHTLPAPALVGNPDLGPHLMAERSIAEVLDGAHKADTIFYSPGSVTRDSVLVKSGFITGPGIDKVRKAGAVGEILSHFVDANGEPLSPELERRTIALPLNKLASAKHTVAVAGEPAKAPALVAAARAGLANVLIIDTPTAEQVLAITSKEK